MLHLFQASCSGKETLPGMFGKGNEEPKTKQKCGKQWLIDVVEVRKERNGRKEENNPDTGTDQ